MAQPQLLQVKLSRFDAQPWGFRLQGGVDFAAPLLVQKVNAGSLSEQAGLQPGDAVLKINDVDVFNLRHKDAQDIVVRSGNNFVITVQRGGSTWRPHVTPTGNLPQPNSPYLQTVTKTSLAHKQQESQHIGCGYNNSARPFANGGDGSVKSIVNKQYNTPVGIYSDESIAETLSAQAEVLAGGVLGVNFKKNEKEYQADKSEVLKFLREEETGPSTPEPHSPANFYWTQSHAIGGNERRTPLPPQFQQQQQPQQQQQQPQPQQRPDERVGSALQQNTLAPTAPHRPSLPVTAGGSAAGEGEASSAGQPDPRVIVMPICPALQGPEYKAEMDAAAAALASDEHGARPLSASGHPACQLCGVGIVGVFVRIKDKNLHVECFKCATCGTSLKNQGYYNFNNKLYCDIHAKLAAQQNPPAGTDGYVPVPIKPNTKLSATTISSALNAHGYNNGVSNGNSTPTPAPVNQGFTRPYGAAAGPPAGAPRSPVSYPPQGQQQQWGAPQQQQQAPRPAGNPYATLPRSNVGQQDEYDRPDQSQTPTRPYTPSLINKPAPIVPFYQTAEKLCFDECPASHARAYDRRSASPFPDRARSPAPGPPPNPLSSIRAPRMKEPESNLLTPRVQQGSITTGQSYLGAQQLQQQQQGQVLSHSELSTQSGSQSYTQNPETITERKVGDLTVQRREQESRLEEQKQRQLQSETKTQIGNTQIERRRKVTEEYEHKQSAKTIEIRTGSQSESTERRESYGRTGFVANQARRLSGLEQEITNLTSQSQAISARAAQMGETTFPQLKSPTFQSKFPLKPVLSPHDESAAPNCIFPPPASSKLVGPPPGFQKQCQKLQQQNLQSTMPTGYSASTVSTQQQKSLSAYTATSLSSTSSTAQASLTKASALTTTNNNQAYAAASSCRQQALSQSQPQPITRPTASAGSRSSSISNGNTINRINGNNGYRPNASAAGLTGLKPTLPTATAAPKPVSAPAPAPAPSAVVPPNISDNKSNVDGSAGAGGKGGAFGATSAPKRGRGVFNNAVGPGVRVPLCNSCNVQIRGPFITALGRIWCPDHFICVNANCRRPLQDIGFVEEKGDLYCEYCFEKYLAPTCSRCSGKIKGDCLNAIGKHFHPECFTCAQCGKIFGNTPFFLEDGNAYCEADWNELFTTKCYACGFPVEAGDRWVEALNHNYHSQCFNCTYCKQNLEGQSFYNKGGRPFCKNHAR